MLKRLLGFLTGIGLGVADFTNEFHEQRKERRQDD
jgi:hypothetical protein